MRLSVISDCLSSFKNAARYWVCTAGTIATAFAVMAPVIVGGTGMALDLGQVYLVKQRLTAALDASALAATAEEYEEDAIQSRVDSFMAQNYPASKIGELIADSVDVTLDGDDVTVEARATYETTFLKLIGIDEISVHQVVKVHKAIKGLEAVLVLDNTGSMGNTNIAHLKTASKKFVEIIFDRAASSDDVKIGVVPYSSSVRIGFYGLGYYPDDDEFDDEGWGGEYTQYGDGTKFVNYPPNGVDPFNGGSPDVKYVTYEDKDDGGSSDNGWSGCVIEHKASGYNAAATHVPGSWGQLWSTHATPGKCNNNGSNSTTVSGYCSGHGWNPKSSSNDPYDDDTVDEYEGPWDIYAYGSVEWSGGSYDGYYFDESSDPTTSCPWAYIQPMISGDTAKAQLDALLDTMQDEGGTYSNLGMAWGLRLLSPEPPFTEGVAWDDPEWKKAVVMMTDGEMSPSSNYGGYWDAGKTTIDNVNEMNDRLLEVCTDLKNKGVTVYTVNFKHANSDISESTKQVYKDCATQPWQDHYKYVTTGAQLTSMFEEIAAALSRLHLSE